ncbi:MAG: hypothetical protein JKX76_01125 [Colwellia sp.]|nr:hypothetical protein [Colwellia sp.]
MSTKITEEGRYDLTSFQNYYNDIPKPDDYNMLQYRSQIKICPDREVYVEGDISTWKIFGNSIDYHFCTRKFYDSDQCCSDEGYDQLNNTLSNIPSFSHDDFLKDIGSSKIIKFRTKSYCDVVGFDAILKWNRFYVKIVVYDTLSPNAWGATEFYVVVDYVYSLNLKNFERFFNIKKSSRFSSNQIFDEILHSTKTANDAD